MNLQISNTVEALVSDHLGNLKKWSPTRMSSHKQLHGKTVEGGRLFEKIKKVMFSSVFISDKATAKLYI